MIQLSGKTKTPKKMFKEDNMKKLLSLLTGVLCFTMAVVSLTFFSASAASTSKSSAENITVGQNINGRLDTFSTHWYKIVPTKTQYYRFTFQNQSIEARTGLAITDSMLNLFLGQMKVTVYNSLDRALSEISIRCGYEGYSSLLLQEGETYYITLSSTVPGNYTVITNEFADIAGNTFRQANQTTATGQTISSIDGDGDEDWFCFTADSDRSYYNFELENISGTGTMYFYLYEYVEGAGDFPLRSIFDFYAYKGGTSSKNILLVPNHKYYYRVTASSSSTGGYRIDVDRRLDSAGNDAETAYAIDTGVMATSSIDGANDVDYYIFETEDYEAYYHFYVDSTNISDYVSIYVKDSINNIMLSPGDHSHYKKAATYNVKLEPNTKYYLILKSATTGNYKFEISAKKDEYANDVANAGEVQLGREYLSSIDGTNDIDCISFTTASYEAYYHFYVDSTNISDYVSIYVKDSINNIMLSPGDHSHYKKAATYDVKLEPNTKYYLILKSATTGNYKFKITPERDGADTKEAAERFSVNYIIQSKLETDSDIDYYKITVNSEQNYRLRFYKESGYASYAYLYSDRDSQKTYVYTSGDSYECVYLEEGTYYIKVCGYNGFYTVVLADCGDGHCETSKCTAKATTSSNGSQKIVCSRCGKQLSTSPVAKIASVALSKTEFLYNGAVQKPSIVIKDADGNKIKSFSAVWSDSSSRSVGTYTVKIVMTGNYSGTFTKTYKINLPATAKVKFTSPSSSSVTISWSKVSTASGYAVYKYNSSTKKYTLIKELGNKTSYTVKGLKAGTKYTFAVRAFKTVNGTKYYSDYKKLNTATITTAPKISKVTAGTKSASVKWNKVSGASGYQIYVATSKNGTYKKVATAKNASSVIKSLKKGKTYYFKVRTYKTVDGVNIYSAFSATKSVKIKK